MADTPVRAFNGSPISPSLPLRLSPCSILPVLGADANPYDVPPMVPVIPYPTTCPALRRPHTHLPRGIIVDGTDRLATFHRADFAAQ